MVYICSIYSNDVLGHAGKVRIDDKVPLIEKYPPIGRVQLLEIANEDSCNPNTG